MTCPTYKMRILIFSVSINLIFSWDISLEILLSNEPLNCYELTILTKKDNLKRKFDEVGRAVEVPKPFVFRVWLKSLPKMFGVTSL